MIKRLASRKTILVALAVVGALQAGEGPVERWAAALGGREKLASIKAIYREATIQYGDYRGTIKVWHTADGRYRKEEQIADVSTIETFDGTNGEVQRANEPARRMSPPELGLATSRRFANANALFFVFFPERRRGTLEIENENTIVLKPEGGIDWHVTLDQERGLPKTMVHSEGDRTVTVSFAAYQNVDGLMFEQEIHRYMAGTDQASVIRFTKTILNPPVNDSLFSIGAKGAASSSGGEKLGQ